MDNSLAISSDVAEFTFSIEFPKAKLLPTAGGAPNASTFSKEGFLESETRWEARLDHADKLDCTIAVSSGIIAGLDDSFFVGKFSLERANEWGSSKANDFVISAAKLAGYEGDDLPGAIRYLEDKFKFAADGSTSDFGGGRQHHLRDFSHHFSLCGLVCSIFTQFTGKVIGTGKAGRLLVVDVPETHRQFLGKSFGEKVMLGTVSWVMHIASDVAGSSSNPGEGTGIPGPILSLIKQLSALPIFQDARPAMKQTEEGGLFFREIVSKMFNGTFFAIRDVDGKIAKTLRFDFRTELGVTHEVARQAMPVILNQCLIRSFYYVRRLAHEAKALQVTGLRDLQRIDPEDVFPFRNKAIARMSTVSCGVFSAVDLSDAAVRAAIASRNLDSNFFKEFVVRVNFIGFGSFAIACVLDIREVLKERDTDRGLSAEENYERNLAELGSLELGPSQIRLLQSLQRAIVLDDIDATKSSRKKSEKRLWLEEWETAIEFGLKERGLIPSEYLLEPDELYREFDRLAKDDPSKPWPFLVALEASLFTPYEPLGGESDKEFKRLKCKDDYMQDVFAVSQDIVSKNDLERMDKALKQAGADIDAKMAKRVVGFVGTAIVAGAATVAAFVFAPYIAPLIAGKAVAGLSGAALTSASLAFVGGGALAAGGLGMAGGTAIIAGGGALLGTIGGTGVSKAIATMTNADGLVFVEASKLLCYCRYVLLDRYSAFDSVKRIQVSLNERILEMEITLESLMHAGGSVALIEECTVDSANEPAEDSAATEIGPKKQMKVLSRSLKYLKRCNYALAKAVSDAERG